MWWILTLAWIRSRHRVIHWDRVEIYLAYATVVSVVCTVPPARRAEKFLDHSSLHLRDPLYHFFSNSQNPSRHVDLPMGPRANQTGHYSSGAESACHWSANQTMTFVPLLGKFFIRPPSGPFASLMSSQSRRLYGGVSYTCPRGQQGAVFHTSQSGLVAQTPSHGTGSSLKSGC
jgi:hypothetical protein